MATPVASFTATPTRGPASLTVVFTDTSTNTPTSWLWEKSSDGGVTYANFAGTPTNQNPTETFAKGSWTVRLSATNVSGTGQVVVIDDVSATDSSAATSGGGGGPIMTRAQQAAWIAMWKSRWTTFG